MRELFQQPANPEEWWCVFEIFARIISWSIDPSVDRSIDRSIRAGANEAAGNRFESTAIVCVEKREGQERETKKMR